MNRYNKNRKNKSISTQLFIEEGHILSDIIYFQYNMITDNMSVYNAINFRKKTSPFVAICKGFSKPRMIYSSVAKYIRRRKYVSVKILKEEGYTLSDVIFVQYNSSADNFNIYDVLKFGRWLCEFVPVFKRFSKPRRKNKFSEAAQNKIRELIEKNSSISITEIMRETGYDQSKIIRYYMSTKRIYR